MEAASDVAINFDFTNPLSTLKVKVTQGSAPYKYVWKKNGETVEAHTSPNNGDSYVINDYGNYTCEVTNACTSAPAPVTFTVTKAEIPPLPDYTIYDQASVARLANLTWSLSGINCFDVSATTGASFPASSTCTVTATGGTISGIEWYILDGYQIYTGQETATGNPTHTLDFADRATVSSAVSTAQPDIPVEIYVYAFITLTKDGDNYKVYDILKIKFDNKPCCEGAIIKNGAYDALGGNGASGEVFNSDFNPNWTDDIFPALNKDLCWAEKDINDTKTYSEAQTSCPAGWRVPNLMELHKLYMELGGNGRNTDGTKFANLKAPNSAVLGIDNMQARSYWSSTTDFNYPKSYNFSFYTNRDSGSQGTSENKNFRPVRCVRTLE